MALSANLVFNDPALRRGTPQERYKNPIVDLLAISNAQEEQENLNTLVKDFVYTDAPPAELPTGLQKLQNLTVSSESIFELLDIIRKRELEIALLEGDKK